MLSMSVTTLRQMYDVAIADAYAFGFHEGIKRAHKMGYDWLLSAYL
jgi:hypothetical protein